MAEKKEKVTWKRQSEKKRNYPITKGRVLLDPCPGGCPPPKEGGGTLVSADLWSSQVTSSVAKGGFQLGGGRNPRFLEGEKKHQNSPP